jgi:hypothetical protein
MRIIFRLGTVDLEQYATLSNKAKPTGKLNRGKEPKHMGRPSSYSPEIAAEICSQLAEGKSLIKVCEDARFPSDATIRSWALDDKEGFSSQYTRAREIGYLVKADEITEIADTETDAAKAKNRIDARKWMLSKMLPKIYGDKLELEHKGSMNIERIILTAPSLPPANRPALLPAFSDGDVIDAETD